MKAIDTNILIRFLMGDDETQAIKVYAVFKKAESDKTQLYVPLLVVMEMIWVLESVYEISRIAILDAIGDLLLMPILKFDQRSTLQQFISAARENTCELSDLLIGHSAKGNGCETVITFDKKAAKCDLFELTK
jgi:predicted nucleic-acid-binding protein